MRGDITKLPKWAQQEITRLERDVEYYKARLQEGPEESNTFADPYSVRRPLGSRNFPVKRKFFQDGQKI